MSLGRGVSKLLGSKSTDDEERGPADRNMLVLDSSDRGGGFVTLRLGTKSDTSLLHWHDGLQAVLAAHLASRLFTTDGHISWIRQLIDVVEMEAKGEIGPKSVPSLLRPPTRAHRLMLSRERLSSRRQHPSATRKSSQSSRRLLTAPSTPSGALYRQYAGEGAQMMTRNQWRRFCADKQGEIDETAADALFFEALGEDHSEGAASAECLSGGPLEEVFRPTMRGSSMWLSSASNLGEKSPRRA